MKHRLSFLVPFVLVAALAVLAATASGHGAAAARTVDDAGPPRDHRPSMTLPDSALTDIELPPASAQKPKFGLDSRLDTIRRAFGRSGRTAALQTARGMHIPVRAGAVLVEIQTAPGHRAEAVRGLEAIGVRVHSGYRDLVAAYAPPGLLHRISGVTAVQRVAAPPPFQALDVIGEEVAETNADTWQAAGYDGTGMKIGIIDLGFSGYTSLLGTELPAASNVFAWGAGSAGGEDGGTEHGTGVAEIVHDIAPGATLYLARIATDADVGNAKDWMVSQGVQVINTSWGSTADAPGDGTGAVNVIASSAVGGGVFWACSAGNYRLRHWMGDFTDADSNGFLDWDGSDSEVNTFYAAAGWPIVGTLRWNDSWTNAAQDYDLRLYAWTGSEWSLAAAGEDVQDGTAGRRPVEIIAGDAPATTYYAWVVTRYSATLTAVDFDLNTYYEDLDDPANPYPHFFDHARSYGVPADNPSNGFMAVGAVGRSPFAQEDYSSEGPTRDGRTLPECAAPASVTTVTYPSFAGTSASSPCLAGLAALVRQAYPSYTPAQVETYLKSSATIDMGAPGPDNQFGSGRLVLPAPPTGDTPPTVTAPNGGESWQVGTSHSITWETGNGGAVAIEVSRTNGSTWETLYASTANDGSESWLVGGATTSQGLVRISNGNGADTSNATFSVTPAVAQTPPTVTAPNGGESWQVGTSHSITWETGNGGAVAIELSRTNGSTWETLFASTANDGSESWLVGGATTSQALVRISNGNGADTSNATFSVTASSANDDDVPGVPIPASPIVGSLTNPGDRDDVYSLQVNAGDLIEATVTGAPGTDFDLYLYRPGTTTVAGDAGIVASAKATTYPDSFAYVARTTGTYFLDVWAYTTSGSGAYTVTYSVIADTTRPTTKTVVPSTSVKRYARATIKYKLIDTPSLGRVYAQLIVKKAATGTIVKKVNLGWKRIGVTFTYGLRCTMARGRYIVFVGGVTRDLAGNEWKTAYYNRKLVVR